jgi:hypothetical protein
MSLSRKEYVAICQTCVKRKFDKKIGLVCSLTGEYADFEDECKDLEIDQLAQKREERLVKQKEEMQQDNSAAFGSEKTMMQSGGWGGLLMIIGGVAWLVGGLALDRIFFYPFFLIIGGIIVLVKAGINKSKEMAKPDTSDILDEEFDEII